MRHTSNPGFVALALAGFAAASAARLGAQTVVWTGGAAPNTAYTAAGNWQGGVPPPDNGTYTIELNGEPNNQIGVANAASVAGIIVPGLGFSYYSFNQVGSGTLTIGAGGIAPTPLTLAGAPAISLSLPVILSANQTWISAGPGYGAYVFASGGVSETGGPVTLTIGPGSVYMTGVNTFSGGVVVQNSGYLNAGSTSAAGTGSITLQDASGIQNYATGMLTLANPVSLGNNVQFGDFSQPGNPLNLSGTVTAVNAATQVSLDTKTTAYLSGTLTGPAGTVFTVASQASAGLGAQLPIDGGSSLVFTGVLGANVAGMSASNAALILAPVGAPAASFGGVPAGGFTVVQQGYLGLDGTLANAGNTAAFLATYGAGLGANMSGTLGFDNITGTGSFSDPIDLSAFTSPGFLGLGSSSAAVLTSTAVITPASGNQYVFGGGGGTLTVQSALADHSGTSLVMSAAPSPVTVLLQGAASYTGGTVSQGGVLIFDTAPPATGTIVFQGAGGYVGHTENAGLASAQAFVNLFDTSSDAAQAVIGFDASVPTNGRVVTDAIDLSGFSAAGTNPFLGTATNATLTGAITPAQGAYQFTGVKGGTLTVTSNLGAATLTLGLPQPIESGGSISQVNLEGDNSLITATTLNSGSVFISSNTALGSASAPISVPDTAATLTPPYLASFGGAPVTLANPISLGFVYQPSTYVNGPGLTVGNASPLSGDMLVLNGTISDGVAGGILGIAGPVTLGGANTYTGGTFFTGSGNAVALVTNAGAFGTGAITEQDAAVISPAGASVALANSIELDGYPGITLGQSGNAFLLTLNGVISGSYGLTVESNVTLGAANTFAGGVTLQGGTLTVGVPGALGTGFLEVDGGSLAFAYGNPTVTDLQGTAGSIALGPSQVLTIFADSNSYAYAGAITGDASNSVVKTGPGTETLSGAATYGGGTTVSAGTLIAASAGALGSGPVTVSSGGQLAVASGVTFTNAVSLADGGALGGSGMFSTGSPYTFANGSMLLPGTGGAGSHSVGALSFDTALTFGAGGGYTLNIVDAAGAAGVGYDTVSTTQALAITATPSNPFVVAVNTRSVDGSAGAASNFSAGTGYTWTLVTAGSVSGFSASSFSVNASGFQNPTGQGLFTVTQNGGSLDLNFVPVPEPSTWMLMAAGAAAVGARWRRRRRG